MATFIHLADATTFKRLIRGGIQATKIAPNLKVVFCVPVVPDFQITFQWLRELKRKGFKTAIGIQFRLPDTEVVLVGRYGHNHSEVTAAQAIAEFLNANDARGLEVQILRSVLPNEIMRVRGLPQISGWRFYPEAKGREPLWPKRGSIKAKRVRYAIEARNNTKI